MRLVEVEVRLVNVASYESKLEWQSRCNNCWREDETIPA